MIQVKKIGVLLFWCGFVLPVYAQTYNGVVYPHKELDLAMGINAAITEVKVIEGDQVKANQLLMVLDEQLQKLEQQRRHLIWQDMSELEALNQRFDILQQKYSVAKTLYETARSISKDDLDGLQLELIQITGRIQQLKAQKTREEVEYQLSKQEAEQRRLYAPITGIITKVALREGEWVKAGEPVITLVDIHNLYVKFSIPDASARQVSLNQKVPLSIQGLEDQTASVSYIAPVADPASGLVEVKVTLSNPKGTIRPGTKASVTFQ